MISFLFLLDRYCMLKSRWRRTSMLNVWGSRTFQGISQVPSNRWSFSFVSFFFVLVHALCNLPVAWRGHWYQHGISSLLEITDEHIQTKGRCIDGLPLEQYYLFTDRYLSLSSLFSSFLIQQWSDCERKLIKELCGLTLACKRVNKC